MFRSLTHGVARQLDPAEVIAKPITIIGDDPRVDLLTLAWSVRDADAAHHAENSYRRRRDPGGG